MFPDSGNHASSFVVPEESSSLFARVWSFCPNFQWTRVTFSCRFTWEFSTSKFEPECPQFPKAKPTLFLSSSFSGLTRDPDHCGERSPFALTVHHQMSGSGSCHSRAITRGCVLSSHRHGTNHNALCGLRENTFHPEREILLKWLPEYVGKLMILNKYRR